MKWFPSVWAALLAIPLWAAAAADSDSDHSSAPEVKVESRQDAEDSDSDEAVQKPGVHIRLRGDMDESANDFVRVFDDGLLSKGQSVPSFVVVLGDGKVDGEVRGDMVVVCGDAKLNGVVKGNLVVVLGSAELGPEAAVEGDAVVVGGHLKKSPGSGVGGQEVLVNFGKNLPGFDSLGRWFKSGLLLGRPLVPEIGWVWVIVGLHFVVYFLIALLLPKPVTACVEVLEDQAVASFFVGLLGFILIGPLIFILTVTVAGLLIVPFVGCAQIAATLVGKTACASFLGLQVMRRLKPETSAASLPAFLLGFAFLCILYMIPFLGFIVWGLLVPLSFGSALMAAFRAFRKASPPAAPPGDPLGGSNWAAGTAGATVDVSGTPGANPANTYAPGSPIPPLTQAYPVGGSALNPVNLAGHPRAGFWIRFAAVFLDFILLCWLIPRSGPFFFFAWTAYHAAMWAWKGTTIGGIVCCLKVVRPDGRPVDFSVALVRALAAVFSALPLFIGFFWAGWSPEKESWHDKIAGTVIVRLPRSMSLI